MLRTVCAQYKEMVAQVLRDTGLAPQYLELEITESTAMQDIDISISTMTRLKNKRIRFSSDDFGTGYSYFSYLKKLPICKVKIDKPFIRGWKKLPVGNPLHKHSPSGL